MERTTPLKRALIHWYRLKTARIGVRGRARRELDRKVRRAELALYMEVRCKLNAPAATPP